MVIPFLCLVRPIPISHHCSTPVSPIPFPTPLFPSPRIQQEGLGENMLGCPRNPANKRQSVAEVVGDQIHSVAIISTVGKDAFHRSRMGMVASMSAAKTLRVVGDHDHLSRQNQGGEHWRQPANTYERSVRGRDQSRDSRDRNSGSSRNV